MLADLFGHPGHRAAAAARRSTAAEARHAAAPAAVAMISRRATGSTV